MLIGCPLVITRIGDDRLMVSECKVSPHAFKTACKTSVRHKGVTPSVISLTIFLYIKIFTYSTITAGHIALGETLFYLKGGRWIHID